jgi:hypothetical protein
MKKVFVGCTLFSVIMGLFNIVGWVSRSIPPNVLEFTIESVYNEEEESITLEKTRVCDYNGAKTIEEVTFRLIYVEDGNLQKKQLSAATPDPITNNCADFTYQIETKELKPNYYQLKATAHDINKNQRTITKEFKVNAPPKNLTFSFQKSYKIGETIKVKSVKVCDDNGSSDIKEINFSLRDDQNEVQKFSQLDMTSSQNKSDKNKSQAVKKPCTASRNHEVSRLKLAAGNYKLTVYAIDESEVNAPPQDILFNLEKSTYTVGEKLTIKSISICDDNGWDDIKEVFFYYRLENSNDDWKKFGSISSFKQNSNNHLCAIYDSESPLTPDLTSPGIYELKAIGDDKESETSESGIEKFTVIAPSTPSITTPDKFEDFNSGSPLFLRGARGDE